VRYATAMAIPRVIYQTFKTRNLPYITRAFIWWMKRVNPGYQYEFYTDQRIEDFLRAEYEPRIHAAYSRLAIGAAKGDFFRYTILYRKGGVYIDIDGAILKSLDQHIIKPTDEAIITREGNPGLFAQWALMFNRDHPILKKTIDKMVDNIENNRYPQDVHLTTGPTVFTAAVNEYMAENGSVPYRIFGVDYDGILIPKHFLNRWMYYQHEHWMKTQKKRSLLND